MQVCENGWQSMFRFDRYRFRHTPRPSAGDSPVADVDERAVWQRVVGHCGSKGEGGVEVSRSWLRLQRTLDSTITKIRGRSHRQTYAAGPTVSASADWRVPARWTPARADESLVSVQPSRGSGHTVVASLAPPHHPQPRAIATCGAGAPPPMAVGGGSCAIALPLAQIRWICKLPHELASSTSDCETMYSGKLYALLANVDQVRCWWRMKTSSLLSHPLFLCFPCLALSLTLPCP